MIGDIKKIIISKKSSQTNANRMGVEGVENTRNKYNFFFKVRHKYYFFEQSYCT